MWNWARLSVSTGYMNSEACFNPAECRCWEQRRTNNEVKPSPKTIAQMWALGLRPSLLVSLLSVSAAQLGFRAKTTKVSSTLALNATSCSTWTRRREIITSIMLYSEHCAPKYGDSLKAFPLIVLSWWMNLSSTSNHVLLAWGWRVSKLLKRKTNNR